MNDSKTIAQAEKAARDYKAVYGKFPEKIGISYQYPCPVPPSIILMELNPIPLNSVVQQLDKPWEYASYTQHCIPLEPIVGLNVKWDEFYLPLPGSETRVIAATLVAKMAREFVA